MWKVTKRLVNTRWNVVIVIWKVMKRPVSTDSRMRR